MVLMALIPDMIPSDGCAVQLWLSCCRTSHTVGSLLAPPKADGAATLLFPTTLRHKPREMPAKSTLMTLAIKKCLYGDLTTSLSYHPFCAFKTAEQPKSLQSRQEAGHMRASLGTILQPLPGWADQQRDVEYSARPRQGSVVPLDPLGGKISVPFLHTGPRRRGVRWCFLGVGKVER